MIIQGKKGSLVFYFNNKIVGSLPLGKRSLQDYEKQRDKLLREALEAEKLKEVKRIMWRGLHKFEGSPFKCDNQFLCMTMLCLIKLRQIDPDGLQEGLLQAPRRHLGALRLPAPSDKKSAFQ